jgi:uncharacterized protein
MEKIKLEIVGISYSQTQSGAYALVLGEEDGKKRLPIIIGGFEAQAIVIEMEDMKPSRPLTHDLFKSLSESFDIKMIEVLIHNLSEGIFYSKIICELNGNVQEIDARTSDAVALALRFKAPIYTLKHIMDNAGIFIEEEVSQQEGGTPEAGKSKSKAKKKGVGEMSIKELEVKLQEAIDNEDYELASKLRDEINNRSKTN